MKKLGILLSGRGSNFEAIAGNVAISIAPNNAGLLQPINAAIDQIKQDGEFDRINSRFLQFRLQ